MIPPTDFTSRQSPPLARTERASGYTLALIGSTALNLWTSILADDALPSLARPFVSGLLLGVGAAVPPGPVNLEIARRATRGGMLAGAAVGLGAVSVDVVLAVLLSLGVLTLVDATPWLRVPISVAGVLLLGYLGVGALRNFARFVRRGPVDGEPATDRDLPGVTPLRGYVTGLLLCSTSPYQAAFWLTGVPAILGHAGGDGGSALESRVALCLGVFAATLTWVACFSGLVGAARSFDRRGRLPAAMDGVGGALLLGFAGVSVWRLGVGLL